MRHSDFFSRIKNLIFFEKTSIRVTLVVGLSVLFGATAMGALESYSSEDGVIFHDTGDSNSYNKMDEQREKALKKAAEEREKALKQASEEREKAMREREKALKQAAEQREKVLKQAAKEREKAMHEREKALKQASEEREKALKQIAEEREKILKQVAEEREKVLRQVAEEREKVMQEREKTLEAMTRSREQMRESRVKARYKTATQRIAKESMLNGINDTYINPITETVYTGNIDRIWASDCAIIEYQQSMPGKVEILSRAPGYSDVDISIEDGMLYVSNHKMNNDDNEQIIVRVISPSLSEITLNGASYFGVNGAISIPDKLLVTSSGASEVNFGEIKGNLLELRSKDASIIYVLTAEIETLKVAASSASVMRLKGLNAGNIIADASLASNIILGGRCTSLTVGEESAGIVNSKGLIVHSVSSSKGNSIATAVPTSL